MRRSSAPTRSRANFRGSPRRVEGVDSVSSLRGLRDSHRGPGLQRGYLPHQPQALGRSARTTVHPGYRRSRSTDVERHRREGRVFRAAVGAWLRLGRAGLRCACFDLSDNETDYNEFDKRQQVSSWIHLRNDGLSSLGLFTFFAANYPQYRSS